jgi:hypothetical protein
MDATCTLFGNQTIPRDSENGFVVSKDQVEACAQRLVRLNQPRHIEHVLSHMQPPASAARASREQAISYSTARQPSHDILMC